MKWKLIVHSGGSSKSYICEYNQGLYGVERLLTVSRNGVIIGQKDPFWPAGIPASKKRRAFRRRNAAIEIIKEYENLKPKTRG